MTAKTLSPAPNLLAQRLQALRQKYVRQLPVKIADIKTNQQTLRLDRGNGAALENLYLLAHGLAGSGATFGFPEISAAAQQAQRFLVPGHEPAKQNLKDGEAGIATLVLALESAVAEFERQPGLPVAVVIQ
jgi:HPt (histidine-containing phosphotransfer) domain-containing protein